ncbi:MAG: flagellar basal body P-ring formation protein FlgA [Pararhodobacter sp.]|nr:flagellar basal body P-ring formation protein FlgA [Pararhodobacter sp.]
MLAGAPPLLAAAFSAAPVLAAFLAATPAGAGEVLIATRTLRASSTIAEADVALVEGRAPPGAATDPEQAVGMEARVTLYAGRPIPLASLAPAALVERNEIVQIVYRHGGLDIRAEGRALGRAGEGESVRVMNLASRSTITGRVASAGIVTVTP